MIDLLDTSGVVYFLNLHNIPILALKLSKRRMNIF